jgi:ribosomal protein L7/L12
MNIEQKRAVVEFLRDHLCALQDEIASEVAATIAGQLTEQVKAVFASEGLVAAIRFYRGQTGLGLSESKATVETIVGRRYETS